MTAEQLFQNFQYVDLQWFIPVLAGLVIIVGVLLVALIRGITAGAIVALLFGGLMSLSPVLLNALERTQGVAAAANVDVARGAAQLAVLNSEVVTDLSRVVATLRTALEGLQPLVAAQASETPSAGPQAAQNYSQSLADTETRLDATLDSLERANLLRRRLEAEIAALGSEASRDPARPAIR